MLSQLRRKKSIDGRLCHNQNSPNHLKLASQSPADNLGIGAHAPRFPPAMADYTFDARPGDGSTIYVLDNGFFLASQVCLLLNFTQNTARFLTTYRIYQHRLLLINIWFP